MLKTVFEKQTCGRCGGSGRFSYNQMDGDTCYGCRGNGEILTKRGRAAHLYYKGLITVMVKDVQEGDTIIDCGIRRRVPTAERKEILMAEALTYQGMLTKQGKMMKKYRK